MTRYLTAVALVLVVLSSAPRVAAAGGTKEETIEVQAEYSQGGRPGGGGGRNCTYANVNVDDFGVIDRTEYQADRAMATSPGQISSERLPDGSVIWKTTSAAMEYRYMWQHCDDGTGQIVWALVATPQNLALGAFERLRRIVPAPIASFQPVDANHDWLYVQVPTDFRIPAWDPITVRVQAGAVWASATATPRVLSFHPGDPGRPGDVVDCAGSATVAAFVPSAPGSCAYTYLNSSSSAGGAFDFELVLVWDVTFDSNIGAPLPPTTVDTRYNDAIQVAEARAVGYAPPS